MFFFFNDTATTEIYTLSLHDALPICDTYMDYNEIYNQVQNMSSEDLINLDIISKSLGYAGVDRKSTRLNSSHANISYAVFCLKKKNTSSSHSRRVLLCIYNSPEVTRL